MPTDSRIINEQVNELIKAFQTLKTEKEFNKFFQDICTVKELHDLAQRFAVANMLLDGKIYSQIEARTGASSATVSRIKKALFYGADGYKIAIDRLNKQKE